MRAEGTAERAAEGRCGTGAAGGTGETGELEVDAEFTIMGAEAAAACAAITGLSSVALRAAAEAEAWDTKRWRRKSTLANTMRNEPAIAIIARF